MKYALLLLMAGGVIAGEVPELVKAQKKWQTKRATYVETCEFAVGGLKVNYAQTIRKIRKRAVAKGDLAVVVQLDKELEGLSTGRLPKADGELKKLRDKFTAEMNKETSIRDEKIAKLKAEYETHLKKLVVSLTKKERVADAIQVQQEIASLSAPEPKKEEPKKPIVADKTDPKPGEIRFIKATYGKSLEEGIPLTEKQVTYVRVPHRTWLVEGVSREESKLFILYSKGGKKATMEIKNGTLLKLEKVLK